MKVSMLTTEDNPFNPFDNFDEWNAYDQSMGYNTCSYLARIAVTSHDLSPADEQVAVNDAIDEILEFNVLGNYKKVEKDIGSPYL